ncbi:hypothetical protein ACFL96_07845 [Thermoproteota archaeon]
MLNINNIIDSIAIRYIDRNRHADIINNNRYNPLYSRGSISPNQPSMNNQSSNKPNYAESSGFSKTLILKDITEVARNLKLMNSIKEFVSNE